MRIIRLYHPIQDLPEASIALNEDAAHHAAVVLRLKPGFHITLFNGNNEEFTATITRIEKKKVWVEVHNKTIVDRESPCHIHLGQAIIKGDRMEWVIQKAVELGVAEITPMLSDHMAVRYDEKKMAKKMAQWQAIIISACEQCGRNVLPVLHAPQTTQQWLGQGHACQLFLLPLATTKFKDVISSGIESVKLAVGPEGGWSEDETKLAKANDWQSIQLGPRIFRSETASLSALSLLQGYLGDI